ncbi:hypothetical protein AVEN_155713-1 [Araneus ventricosus]|uniref:Uncharacterized protein n=1 Tax=Araneus ventricosus TaxID=182803 RepID=A0A4Y2SBS8_ARAVE|nr:hypothetical protein AVEN_33406-1 [Araneus ventricosus]GBN85675.1 hypothetical protein AVEN_182083-1 [Araneus ventricosus]GBN88906.1 hypothetical protein AVEN_65943-1 [Araneus ventricosus]GBN88907.1 hypothetical protein AVEN_155713-1 [Araneus ventricosus]
MLPSSRRAEISQRLASVHGTRPDPTASRPESSRSKPKFSVLQTISHRSLDPLSRSLQSSSLKCTFDPALRGVVASSVIFICRRRRQFSPMTNLCLGSRIVIGHRHNVMLWSWLPGCSPEASRRSVSNRSLRMM